MSIDEMGGIWQLRKTKKVVIIKKMTYDKYNLFATISFFQKITIFVKSIKDISWVAIKLRLNSY